MTELNRNDMNVLSYYADKGDRVRYWNYLAQRPGADGYGRLALSVVRNDETPGALANHFAERSPRRSNTQILLSATSLDTRHVMMTGSGRPPVPEMLEGMILR